MFYIFVTPFPCPQILPLPGKELIMAKRTTGLNLSAPKSYASLVYGALTVVVIFLILFFGIRAIQQRQASITPFAEDTTAAREYEVKGGDSLWTIAENEYKDGYKWTEIAAANKIANPDLIEKGMKLILPAISPEKTTIESPEKITGDSYKVVEGDSLWDISVRAYGDGYKWVEIARENRLTNPDLIYPGNEFKLPR